MGLFDTILDAALDDEGGGLMDTFRGFLSDDGEGSSGDAGPGEGGGVFGRALDSFLSDDGVGESGGWERALGSLFGGDAEDGGGDDAGGWGSALGSIVDRFSGDGGRQGLWDRATDAVVDRISPYLPEEVRGIAGQFFGQDGAAGRGSSWAGSLVDPGRTEVPSGWHGVANHPAAGHRFGESGFGGLLGHSIAGLAGDHGRNPAGATPPPWADDARPGTAAADVVPGPNVELPIDDGMRYIRAPDIEPGRAPYDGQAGHDRTDPRVTMPTDALGGDRYADTDGDGRPDAPGLRPADDADGDGYPDATGARSAHDADGDGHPDAVGPRSGYDDRADYDDLVTSGARPSDPGYEVPDDPTFPVDAADQAAVSGPAAMPADQPDVEAPATDFQQSIDDADQVDQSMDAMFDGLEGPA